MATFARRGPDTWRAPAIVLLANPAMIQACAVGQDIWAAGFAMGTTRLAFDARTSLARGAFLAMVLSARLPLIALASVVRGERHAAWLGAALAAAALHTAVALWTLSAGGFYAPAHLIDPATAAIGVAELIRDGALATWEGKRYVGIGLPVVAIWWARAQKTRFI